jgi:hypothetical protein
MTSPKEQQQQWLQYLQNVQIACRQVSTNTYSETGLVFTDSVKGWRNALHLELLRRGVLATKRALIVASLLAAGFQGQFSNAATGCSSNSSGGTTPLPELLPAVKLLTLDASDPLNTGDLQYGEVARLVKNTVCSEHDCTVDSGAYVLINVITWRTGPTAESHWFVYRGGAGKWSNDDFSNNGRMYGAKSTYLLSLQVTLGVPVTTTPAYSVEEDKRVPQNLQDLTALLQNIAGSAKGGGSLPSNGPNAPTPIVTVYWTGKQLVRTHAGGADMCIASAVLQPSKVSTTIATNKDVQAPVATPQTVVTPAGVATQITLTGADPNKADLRFTVVKRPTHGNLSGTPPTLTYTPNVDYSATAPDSFTFEVENADGTQSDTATVSVVTKAPVPQAAKEQSSSPSKAGLTGATLLAVGADNPTTVTLPNFSVTDEPKQWIDVSIAVPISKISDVTYSSTNGTVTPNTVNRQSVFAVADFYFPKKDMVGNKISYWPHPIIGVSMASKPLQSWIAGAGIGLPYGEVYAGANIIKTSTLGIGLSTGSSATAAQVTAASGKSWTSHFNVGLNISVVSAFKTIKSATTGGK